MYCTYCNKDIQWIEVHLQQNHLDSFLNYLQQKFEVDLQQNHDLIECYLCGNRVKWLQDHLYNKHRDTSLMSYVHQFYISENKMNEYVDGFKLTLEDIRQIKKKTVTRIHNLKECDQEVLAFQRGEIGFEPILVRWQRQLKVQLSKSYNLVSDITKQEGIRELEQELHSVLFQAAKSYDSDKAVFNTYMWNCVKSHLATIASYNKASKRNFTMVGAEDVLGGFTDDYNENNDKISLLSFLNSEDSSTFYNSKIAEFHRDLDTTGVSPFQKLIIQAILNNLSKQQMADLFSCKVNIVDKSIKELRDNSKLKALLV